MNHLLNREQGFFKKDFLEVVTSLQTEAIQHCSLFGSSQKEAILKKDHDIDLLFIVNPEMKSPEVAFEIYNTFQDYGEVRFHPDFYSLKSGLTFEIIVLPQNSNYFMNLGTMTGLNAFVLNQTELIFGPQLHNLIGLPSSEKYEKLEERLRTYNSAHYGINHMLSEVFSRITKDSDNIDLKKLFKIILLDYIWLKTNHFYNSTEELIRYIEYESNKSIRSKVKYIIEIDKLENRRTYIVALYELLIEIKKEIKADNTLYK